MRAERRGAPRSVFSGGYLPPPARVRPSTCVTVVNLSSSGALIEGTLRLRPGAPCELSLDTAARTITVAAVVMRAFVARLESRAPVRYRAALVFETSVLWTLGGDLLEEYLVPAPKPFTGCEGVAAARPTPAASHDRAADACGPADRGRHS
jgi:hypothetical protein